MSYGLRFVHNISSKITIKKKRLGPLSNDEIQKSVKTLIKLLQNQFFGEALSNKKLKSLNSFFGNENILHVGGRLGNVTDLTYDQRYPIMISCLTF